MSNTHSTKRPADAVAEHATGLFANATDAAAASNTYTSSQTAIKHTGTAIKQACQELLKTGLVEKQYKPNIYQTIVASQSTVSAILEPLDLSITVDEVRGLAFLAVAQEVHTMGAAGGMDDHLEQVKPDANDDGWSHPLVRKQRLKLEHSLLIAILRQLYVAHEREAGIGATRATVDLDYLQSTLKSYWKESGSDTIDRKRLVNLLENLKAHGLVSDITTQDEVQIRPIITHVASPNTLIALLQHFQTLAAATQAPEQ